MGSIEMHHKSVQKAGPGDNVGINVKGLPKENMPKVGDVAYVVGEAGDDSPPAASETFKAAVFVQDHPGQLKCANHEGKGGFTPSIHVRTAKAPCQMMKILWKRGKSTSNVKVELPMGIEAGDEAEVIFKPKMPLCVDAYDVCKPLGRMAAMDSNSLIMLGRVLEATKKKDDVSFPPLAFFFITGRPVQSITFTRGSRSPLFFSLLYSESGIASFLSDKFSEQCF